MREGGEYMDLCRLLGVVGFFMLAGGIVVGLFGPIEMYCFYLFSEGGRFHFPGFRFGSFSFGNIAFQIIGYYLIAAVLIPLGYGHLTRRRWARTLTLALVWSWLVVGAPLALIIAFTMLTFKELGVAGAAMMVVVLALLYPILPGLLVWFYGSKHMRLTFEQDPGEHWTERVPLPSLVLGILFAFYAVALHVSPFFNGIFPLFGVLLFGLPGMFLADVAILSLGALTWGILRLKAWAWWGSVVYFGLLIVSLVWSLSTSTLGEVLEGLNFPPTEMEALQGMPLHGAHLAAFLGLPLIVTLGVILFSKRYYLGWAGSMDRPAAVQGVGEAPAEGG